MWLLKKPYKNLNSYQAAEKPPKTPKLNKTLKKNSPNILASMGPQKFELIKYLPMKLHNISSITCKLAQNQKINSSKKS